MDTDRRRTANRRVRLYVAALAVALLTIIGGSPASATSPGRTKGDAQAVFNVLMGALYATSALNPQGTPHGTPEGAPGEGIPPGSHLSIGDHFHCELVHEPIGRPRATRPSAASSAMTHVVMVVSRP